VNSSREGLCSQSPLSSPLFIHYWYVSVRKEGFTAQSTRGGRKPAGAEEDVCAWVNLGRGPSGLEETRATPPCLHNGFPKNFWLSTCVHLPLAKTETSWPTRQPLTFFIALKNILVT
jgi:hypothetical protein